jgi:hypothetical protein
MDTDPSGHKVNHTPTVLIAITDPIYQSPPESNSEGDREVFMVGERDEPTEKTTEGIAHEAEEEITWVARIAKEADKGKCTTACRMTLGHLMMSLGTTLPRGGTTQRSTHGALLAGTDSETSHSRSARKSAISNIKANKSIAR